MNFSKSLIIPFSPSAWWQLKKDEVIIDLGPHWPKQKIPPRYKGFKIPIKCNGNLYVEFSEDGSKLISIGCNQCSLMISATTQQIRFSSSSQEFRMKLAGLILVSANGQDTTFPISFPIFTYFDSNMTADIPLMDTGFSTTRGDKIYLGLFLPTRYANWDLNKGEWVPEETLRNLSDASTMIIKRLKNNSKNLEAENKKVFGR